MKDLPQTIWGSALEFRWQVLNIPNSAGVLERAKFFSLGYSIVWTLFSIVERLYTARRLRILESVGGVG
jgi:hypothetical protein